MAVSMNTGGYMRSDFMISDAAIPMRIEELDAQAAQFAQLLSGTDNIPDTTVLTAGDTAAVTETDMAVLPQEFQQLAEKIADGELSLEDIPKELLTDDLIKAVLSLKKPKPEKETEDNAVILSEAAQQAVQLAAGFVQADIPDDKTDELTEIAAAVAVEEPSEKTQSAERLILEYVPDADIAEAIPVQAPEKAQPTIAINPIKAEQSPTEAFSGSTVQQADTEVQPMQEQSVQQQVQQEQTASIPGAVQLTAEQTEVLNTAAANGEISRVRVKPAARSGAEKEPSEPGKAKSEVQQSFGVADRIKPAGEELEMLRNAKLKPEAAPANEKAETFAEETAKPAEIPLTEQPEAAKQPRQQEPRFEASADTRQPTLSEAAVQIPEKSEEQAAESEQTVFVKAAQTAESSEGSEKPAQTEVPAAQTYSADQPFIVIRHNGERIEVSPRDIISQATVKLMDTAKEMTEDSTEYSIVLNPEELGRITVKLTKAADGAVSVTIAAENERTQRILEQNSQLMQNDLKNSGVRLESWQTVNETQQEHQAQDYNGSSKNPYRHEEHRSEETEADDVSFADIMASM